MGRSTEKCNSKLSFEIGMQYANEILIMYWKRFEMEATFKALMFKIPRWIRQHVRFLSLTSQNTRGTTGRYSDIFRVHREIDSDNASNERSPSIEKNNKTECNDSFITL